MVKSKKLSRGSLAVLLMALMLALSMVVGMTGAWFTSQDSETSTSTDKTFGIVAIDMDAISEGAWSNTVAQTGNDGDPFVALPGSVYAFNGSTVANTSNVDIYVLIDISDVTVTFTPATGSAVEKTAVDSLFIDALTAPAVSGQTEVDHANCPGMYRLNGGADMTLTGGSVKISVNLANAYQGGTVSIEYTLAAKAVQVANWADAAAAYAHLQALV